MNLYFFGLKNLRQVDSGDGEKIRAGRQPAEEHVLAILFEKADLNVVSAHEIEDLAIGALAGEDRACDGTKLLVGGLCNDRR